MERELYVQGLTSTSFTQEDGSLLGGEGGLLRLENSLLKLGGLSEVCMGMFYFVGISFGHYLVLRYMETGCYRIFMTTAMELFQKHIPKENCEVIPWNVYTDLDVKLKTPESQPCSK